jgi:transposase
MPKPKITGELSREVIRLYQEGNSSISISKTLDISKPSVLRILKVNGIERRTISEALSKCTRDAEPEIIKLYNQGSEKDEIVKITGLCKATVQIVLNRNNVQQRPIIFPTKLTKKYEAALISLYTKGVSMKKLAGLFDINDSTVLTTLKKYNIKRKTKEEYYKKISDELEQEIITLYQQGIYIYKLSEKFNLNKTTISRLLKKNNIYVKNSKDFKKLNEKQEQEIVNHYQSWASLTQLAEMYNVSTFTIKRTLKNYGAYIKSPAGSNLITWKITKKDEREIIKLYQQGLSLRKIAEKFDVIDETIASALKRNNVRIRSRTAHIAKINKKQHKEIISLYNQGLSSLKIAKMFNVTSTIILSVLKKNNIERRNPGYYQIKIDQEKKEIIIRLYQEGNSLKKIAGVVNLGKTSIEKFLKKHNLYGRNKKNLV